MTNRAAAWVGGLAALACTGPLRAHHSGYMYQTTPLWVRGAVVGVENRNPHTIVTVEERGDDGRIRRLAIEGPARFQLERMGIVGSLPQVGDVIEVCAFPYKSPEELSRIFPGVDFVARSAARAPDAPEFVAGHVLVMPDGERTFWEPHGVMGECMRTSDDQRQSWLEFLNADARARQAWCEQRRHAHVQSTPSLQELVVDVDELLANPCQ